MSEDKEKPQFTLYKENSYQKIPLCKLMRDIFEEENKEESPSDSLPHNGDSSP